jgi:hypothetical protein
MIAESSLKDLLSKKEYSRADKLLLVMAVDSARPKSIAEIRTLASNAGLTEAKKWNIADILARSKPNAIRSKDGWELTSDGRRIVSDLAGPYSATVAPKVAAGLRHYLVSVADDQTRDFLEEAVLCLESELYRAAVVLSWVGAVAVLQDHVLNSRLADFNAEAKRRDSKWKDAKTRDDLSRLKEAEFLNILEAISVAGKSVKQELEGCLRLRNGCGHPNTLKIGDAKVAAHLETLIQNVFSRF